MAVIDASFVLTILPSDPKSLALTGAFPRLRRRFELRAPYLIRWETGNTIHGKLRRAFGPNVQDRMSLHETLLEGIHLEPPTDASWKRTALLAERFNLTFYDAAYLAQTELIEGAILWTEDRRLRTAADSLLGQERVWDVAKAVSTVRPGPTVP